jgi:hypothetical protein
LGRSLGDADGGLVLVGVEMGQRPGDPDRGADMSVLQRRLDVTLDLEVVADA